MLSRCLVGAQLAKWLAGWASVKSTNVVQKLGGICNEGAPNSNTKFFAQFLHTSLLLDTRDSFDVVPLYLNSYFECKEHPRLRF